MTDYARVRLGLEYSEHADYSRPIYDQAVTLELTPDELFSRRLEVGAAGALSVDLSAFAAVTSLLVINTHATDYVTLGYTSSGAATACSMQVPAGDFAKVTDVDASVAVTLQSGAGDLIAEMCVTGT